MLVSQALMLSMTLLDDGELQLNTLNAERVAVVLCQALSRTLQNQEEGGS
jgi:hypothetical protein